MIEIDEFDEKILNNLDDVKYWYHKAAENDNKVALYNLGKSYELQGVCENNVRAFEFYKQSADKGFADAQFKVGCYYNNRIAYITCTIWTIISRIYKIATN